MTSFGRHPGARTAILAALGLGSLILAACGHRFGKPDPAAPPVAAPSDPAANALWARSLQSASDTPLKAHVVITTRGDTEDDDNRRSVLEMVEGTGGRFLLKYSQPAAARGRVVVCDGSMTWQYEPRSRTVLRRPTHESVVAEADDPDQASTWRREIEAGSSDVSGRPTQILRIRSGDGKIAERIWIDTATGRSLRTETYDSKGRVIRAVELSQIAVKPVVTAETFRPNIPPGSRVLTASARVSPDIAAETRLLDLPTETAGYRVQSVVRSPHTGGSEVVHVLYSNGPRALSVFVTGSRSGAQTQLVPPAEDGGATWKPASLTSSVHAYTQEQTDGQSAVAWVGDSHRYVAVSRLPLTDLLSVARTMVDE